MHKKKYIDIIINANEKGLKRYYHSAFKGPPSFVKAFIKALQTGAAPLFHVRITIMETINWTKEHRRVMADGAEATFEVPIAFSKAYIGKFTNNVGEQKDGRIIEGIASTEGKDQQGEVVLQDKMDCSYLLEKGYLNWNHSHAPEDQIGKPLEVVKLPGGPNTPNNLPATYFRALLFDNVNRAEAVWTLSKAIDTSSGHGMDRSLGFSVEGGVKVRNGNVLVETVVRHMAVTHEPVNAQSVARCVMAKSQGFKVDESVLIDTVDDNVPHFIFKSYGALMKSLYFVTETDKAMSIGSMGGASPLMLENLSRIPDKRLPTVIELLDTPCAEGMSCQKSLTHGYHGALDHLVYCVGLHPRDASNMIISYVKYR